VADVPTAEASARHILEIFLAHGLRAGDVLQSDSFIAPFSKPGRTVSDFDSGLEYAIDEDWIELVSSHSYRLTAEGFAEAR
jgi:hypothetical protein